MAVAVNRQKRDTTVGTICYLRQRGTPEYVFIHGLGGQKDLFSGAFDHPTAIGKGITCVDLLGYGESNRLDADLQYSFRLQAETLKELLLGLGTTRFHLVLHSMAAALLPALVKSKELEITTIFLLEGNLLEEDAGWSRSLSMMSDEEYRVYFAKLRKHAHIILAQQLRRPYSKAQIKEWARCFINADERVLRETAHELYAMTCRGDILMALHEFSGRVVYLRGVDDREWHGYDLLPELGIELVKVANAGHYLMLDDPEQVYGEIFEEEIVPETKSYREAAI